MNEEASSLVYQETQRLGPVNRALTLGLGLVMIVAVVVPFGRGLSQQLFLKQPWGNEPAPDAVLVGAGALALLVSLLPFLLLSLTLTVEVTTDDLVVRLEARTPIPLMRPRRIPHEEIVDAAIGSEFPLGAGASRGWRREGYRVNGRDGVKLTLRSGKTVFVGSQRPQELLEAVERLRAS
jgi:hypothetical protein